jgi:hypothetical protein
MGVFTLLVAFIKIHYFPQIDNLDKLIAVYSLVGFAISLLLVFRTNTAYDRWWEGRRKWGELVNDSRNLSVKLNAMLSDTETKIYFARLIGVFVVSMKEHLRNGIDLEQLELTEEEKKIAGKSSHIPATIAWLESKINSEGVSSNIGRAVSLKVDDRIKALLLVPENQLSTAKARKLLPESISHQDAVLNSSRTALLVHALAERPDLLFTATEDLLHQKYREEAMPKSIALVEKLRGAGLAAVVSGAGPSVMVLYSGAEDEIDQIQSVSPGFTAMKLAIAKTGVQ